MGRLAFRVSLLVPLVVCFSLPALAQLGPRPSGATGPEASITLMVVVRDETGGANTVPALVTISQMQGGMLTQGVTDAGRAEFNNLVPGLYTVRVYAAGYAEESQTVNVYGGFIIAQFQLRPDGEASANSGRPPNMPILSPKAQKLASKAAKEMQDNQLEEAHKTLDQLYQLAPSHPSVTYLYGLCESRMGNHARAKELWQKTLQLYPNHIGALLQLSQLALKDNHLEEATPLLYRAVEADPAAWRPHAMLAQLLWQQKLFSDAVKEADRALELGHNRASTVQPLLARSLDASGNRQRAKEVLANYLREHPDDASAQKLLEQWNTPATQAMSAAPPEDHRRDSVESQALGPGQRPEPAGAPSVVLKRDISGETLSGAPGSSSKSRLSVEVRDQEGTSILEVAVVTLSRTDGKLVQQQTAEAGRAVFEGVAAGHYLIQVVADGYASQKHSVEVTETAAVATIQLRRGDRAESDFARMSFPAFGSTSSGQGALTSFSPKIERLTLKIAEALQANQPEKARPDLEVLYREAPTDADASYLYGVYEREVKNIEKARYYWLRALGLSPKHLAALLELGHAAMEENKLEDAIAYLDRAAKANPKSWRPHALLVVVYSKGKRYDEAAREADRALELGQGQAAFVELVLASNLADAGQRDRARGVLESYLKSHPDDAAAKRFFESLQPSETPQPLVLPVEALAEAEFPPLLPSQWMPATVDEAVSAVEPGVPCSLETVLHGATRRIVELVRNVDRFSATESLDHTRVRKKGQISGKETRTFHYVVSIEEIRPGLLSVEEYRAAARGPDDPPDGVHTMGLPGLVLVFHPLQIADYNFTCEGLAQTSSGLAWQVRFRQRSDRIPTLHGYSLGGQSFAVALKGRAWIAADSFQVVRLETDLVKPYPEIRLVAEHTLVEYAPVRFHSKEVQLWLPRSAEVYFDWLGRRVHRRLSYSDYVLFSVDDKQLIKAPKASKAAKPS